ncbi:hypothetical protein KY333_03245 [Candidatus Woesearchaeota archaeon]|nr:hypothetical protein [Candidatus Woesearchaeota archaeon]
MATNNSLEGLTLGLAATGGMSSLGWNILSHLVLNSNLTEEGIIGSKKGIAKICIYNRDFKKTAHLIQHAYTLIEKNKDLSKRAKDQSFSIQSCRKINEIADNTDVLLIGYDTVPGIERRNALKTTSARSRSLNSNIPVLHSWQSAFKDYDGLLAFLTNPSDYMTYFGIDILGLDRDQVVGFDHVDTFRLRNEFKYLGPALEELAGRPLSTEEKSTAINALSELNDYTAFIIGNHSADSFGLFSNMTCGKSNTPWNQIPVLSDEKVKKGIISLIHKKARELSEVIDGPNANCIPPIIDVIKGIVTGEGVFEMAYYLEISSKLQKKIKKKYDADIAGVCTGIPVTFTKDSKKIRAEIADKFQEDSHKVKFPNATKEEKEKFEGILERNASQIAEATVLKNKEGEYRFLEENTILILRNILSDKLLLKETKKSTVTADASILLPGKQTELEVKEHPTHYDSHTIITAMAAHKNKLIAASCQARRTIHIWELPYSTSTGLCTDTDIRQVTSTDIGPMQNGKNIEHLLMDDNAVYIAEAKAIEKRDMNNLTEENPSAVSLDEEIWSLDMYESSIFAACSNGRIEEIDTELSPVASYTTADSEANMTSVKIIELNSEKYVFGINEDCAVYIWKNQDAAVNKALQLKNNCFDIQVENTGSGEKIAIYHITDDNYLAVSQVDPEKGQVIETEVTKISCSPETRAIKISGNEVFLMSNKRVKSFINKTTLNLDYSPSDKFIEQIDIIKYQK